MSAFLLIVVTILSNGAREVTVERFNSGGECHSAMVIVNQEVPGATVYCRPLTPAVEQNNE